MMKNKNLIQLVCSITFVLLACSCIKEDFDEPPLKIPTVDFKANTTIQQLKATYSGGLDSIKDTIIIQGVVISSDEHGNIYKSLFIQDSTGGIMIALDRTNLYTTFKIGQKVLVKCKGLFLGNYGGTIQLGYKDNNTIGRIPNSMIDAHIFRDGLPGNAPQPKKVKINQLTTNDICTYIQLDSIRFQEVGVEYASQMSSYTNLTLLDSAGNSIILRTSKYADFAYQKTPPGMGSIRGILTIYGTTYQILINSINDIFNWNTSATFESIIYSESFTTSQGNFTTYSVKSNKNWYWSSQYTCMVINGYQADEASEDWLISPPINLTTYQSAKFNFRTWTKYTDPTNSEPLTIWISYDYDGISNPNNFNWTKLTATLPAQNSTTWTSSGDINISSYVGKIVYIGFKYTSTSPTSATQWEVDEFKVIAK
ncbi:MAG: DUF5689 domain-containing protein [Bacteroidales bacterium]|nr:DUF5689 domain-containing protein [Bacteroidales bacterium]